MRHKLLVLVILVLLCCEFSEEQLQGPEELLNQQLNIEPEKELTKKPQEDSQKAKDVQEKKEFISSLQDEDGTSALKIVPAPDLSKEELKEVRDRRKEVVDLLMSDQAKVLQKMVQEFDLLKSTIIDQPLDNDVLEEDDIPPLPDHILNPPELTEEQREGVQLYTQAQKMLSKMKPDKEKAYKILKEASHKGNAEAKALIAWAKLFGNPLEQNLSEANDIFSELSDIGHPDGHTGLGFLYASGLTVNVSQARALVHYTFGALGGNTWAQMALGYRYWSGVTVQPGCEKSLDFYRKVADKVSQSISFGGGVAIQRIRLLDEHENGYTSGILDKDLIEYYQLLAEKGDVQAQIGLGQLHYQGGRGVDLDYQKALQYFTQAANSGNAIAMAYLGKIYLDGSDDIKADNSTAFKYFKKASDLNNPVGLSGLGLMYLYGKGVEKDYNKAYKFFTAAADQGWVDGQLQLGIMHFNGLGVRKDYKLANKYFSLASQSGHVLAYYNMGQMHAQGNGMLRSCPTAVEFFKNVAERARWGEILMQAHNDYKDGRRDESFVQYAFLSELGYEVAQSNTGFLLDRNEVPMLTKDEALTRGLLYWGRAAAQGYSAAQVKLGDYHYYGLGTQVDYEMAATHYRLASDQQHNAQAMFNLGYMHEQGLGMSRDMHLAKRCYDLAAETSADAKVPVALALLKLNLMFSLENVQESRFSMVYEMVSANWDLYVITILSGVLAAVVYFRRPQVRV